MIKTPKLRKGIHTFVDSLLKEKDPLPPDIIANKFRDFCELCPPFSGLYAPLTSSKVISACYSIGINSISFSKLPDKLRGFNHIYDNKIQISLRQDDWEGGISHTLLHELFEVIIKLYNAEAKIKYNLTEYKANLFAASVLMPEEIFLDFAFRAHLDLQLIRDKYYQSLFSLILRLHYLFKKRNTAYVGFLAENQMAYNYSVSPRGCNDLRNFIITNTTRAHNDLILGSSSLYNYLEEVHWKMTQQGEDDYFEDDYFIGSVKIEKDDFLIKASPILNEKNNVIRQIGIQIISKNDFEKIKDEICGDGGTYTFKELAEDCLNRIQKRFFMGLDK